ncbi:1,4-alpha-glucan branching protein GlgB [Neobacillus mesonae]|uniref:1,4-alpha-glucan branching protein GlgB n=1 Tax=Neobacillus mesonae TaxID=1193713 RepID=UPI00203C195F|nr:1,4-alpha-glucan branching protein GlgB [Neobacillus mesonae]MCM3571431.1 1,4-alpha-glucan branching protein GlgB [Neobacillus mesonae]
MTVNTLFPTDYQLHLFHEGNLFQSHHLFGAHVIKNSGNSFTRFCVWAPNAKQVRLVGDFNKWNGREFELQRMNEEGIWILVVNQDLEGEIYKYEIITHAGEKLLKADPFAFYAELRPHTASIVYPLKNYEWRDHQWMNHKNHHILSDPLVIYEVHIGSWRKKEDGSYLTYKEMAEELIPYVMEHGFTHIELLPLVEHPLDDSWGYQGTGYFSVTSRYGEPDDFKYLVDQCHQHGIGVILDWVPGHFCKDAHGLYRFDGTHLYSYQNHQDRENVVWGTANFDLGRGEVQSFLISNALFWMDWFHIDGFRMDAVANIIYWPNTGHEKRENPLGIGFLKKLNRVIEEYNPNFLMIGEDSTEFPHVTAPARYGGLGFDYKWNMGWMNDVLEYMETPPFARSLVHSKITFSLLYAFSENFMLPFSHDEVVHGKKSLLDKMPGDYWEKFAQLRLLLGFMFAHPGKKLLFMGFEFGQFAEWKDKEQLDWNLLDYEMHQKMSNYVKMLMKLYKRSKSLYELDHLQEGFEWIDADNSEQSIFSFIRKGKKDDDLLIIVCNFTGVSYQDYKIGVPNPGPYREIFNSDQKEYGGSDRINKKNLMAVSEPFHGKPNSLNLTIAPFGFHMLRPVKKRKERKGNGKENLRGHVISRREGQQAE